MSKSKINPHFDWKEIAKLALRSRGIDELEESRLYPHKVPYQFSARGHEVPQIILGSLLTHKYDSASAYYRSRPLLMSFGLTLEDAFSASMAKSGSYSDGRDVGAVCNWPGKDGHGPVVLPMAGDVGAQYTPAAGWAQGITYHRKELKDQEYEGAISVVLGGDGSVATNGFWSSLTMATTLKLPMLFYIEDNGYAISVPSTKQTPGQNIAENLSSFKNLRIIDTVGSDPLLASEGLHEAVSHVRAGNGPVLIRLTVPRLCGHSGQDTQAYKGDELIKKESSNDPLNNLKNYLVPELFSEKEWDELKKKSLAEVEEAYQGAENRPNPDPKQVTRYEFAEFNSDGTLDVQLRGGLAPESKGESLPSTNVPKPENTRTNMLTAIRRTLDHELSINSKVLVFGEDVGAKGGVHGATLGLHDKYGENRVFDTSLSEEGIIGRSTGLACAGLMPVAEIQFRKYADPATEQLNNCGMVRWRTKNRFASPVVVRIPGGYFRVGDPWHAASNEVGWTHEVGWQVCYPSNAEDAVGLLRAAMRGHNPTIFFEQRHCLDNPWARRGYPGDDYVLPLGKGKTTVQGDQITIVTWGAMVERCELAGKKSGQSVEVIDLRTLVPWDRELVLNSVKKTHRCLIVHEDRITSGFGAEISAVVSKEGFLWLDAPIERMAVPDIPIPYNVKMMESILPSVDQIAAKIQEMIAY